MASTRGQLGGAGLAGEPNPGAFPSGGEPTGASAITAGQGAVVRCLTAKYQRAARSEQRAGCLRTGKEQASGPFPVRSEQRNISGRLAQNSEPVASEQAKNRLRGRSSEPGLIARSFPRPIPAARPGANAGSWSRGNPGQLPGGTLTVNSEANSEAGVGAASLFNRQITGGSSPTHRGLARQRSLAVRQHLRAVLEIGVIAIGLRGLATCRFAASCPLAAEGPG
jgi:hypothetical protein